MKDEKDFDLRDKFAMEIFNGLLSNSKESNTADLAGALAHYLNPDMTYVTSPEEIRLTKQRSKGASDKIERVVRACYMAADIFRKVRMSAFE